MTPSSLRLRLILVSALAIVVTLTIAGLALSQLFANHLERAQFRNLADEFNRLTALVEPEGPKLALTQPMADPHFAAPYGGIYWQVRDPQTGELLRSRSMWDKVFDTSAAGLRSDQLTEFRILDPEGAPSVGVGRQLAFEKDDGTERTLELVVVEDNVDTEAATAGYRADLFRGLAVLAILLVLVTWAQVTVGLRPLKAIRAGLSAIRAGRSATLAGKFPLEVVPLVNEVNELMQAQETTIQFARERAADLAHGLKGRLQSLNAEAHDIRLKGDEASARAIEALTAEMAETIDHQLGLSRLRRRSPQTGSGTEIGVVAEKVVNTVRKTIRGAELDWIIDLAPGLTVALDRSDLSELVGALVENAAKWAAGAVRVSSLVAAGQVTLSVEDDGPGMDQAQIDQLGTRGIRLDEQRSGSGIGISIVREIVSLNAGRLEFGRSALGGLLVRVSLPAGHTLH